MFWYKQIQHKSSPMYFSVDPEKRGQRWREELSKTANGYKIVSIYNEELKPIEIAIRAPKYRTPRKPKKTLCELCGFEWYRGNPDSSAEHRREHAKRLRYIDPKPIRRISTLNEKHQGLVPVRYDSPIWLHRIIYSRAKAFRRKLKYVFIQWESPQDEKDLFAREYLFVTKKILLQEPVFFAFENTRASIYGACSGSGSQKNLGARAF